MRCGSSLYYYLTFFTQIDIKYILNIYVYTKYENIESDRSKDRSEQRVFCQHKIDTRRGSYLSRVKFTRCLLFEHRSRSAQSSPACLGSQLSLGSRSSNIFTRKCIHTHTQVISTDTDALHQNSTAKTRRHDETAPSGHRKSSNIFIEKFHRKTDWSKSYYAFRGLPIDFDGSTINRGNLATVFNIDFL